MSEREKGHVKWFNAAKGFGFISREGAPDVYVHFSEIMGGGYRELDENELVEFSVKDTPKGPQAIQVVRITKG
ncbi:MAG: cold shock domain-containing protein [bacterium]|jgi:CspA family cold shock protein